MEPEMIYMVVVTGERPEKTGNRPYRCLGNRAYRSAYICTRDAEQYTAENVGAIAVVVSFTVKNGLTVEASYIGGHADMLHAIGVRECKAVYAPCILSTITAYLDTICRANAEKEGNCGQA